MVEVVVTADDIRRWLVDYRIATGADCTQVRARPALAETVRRACAEAGVDVVVVTDPDTDAPTIS
jgi:hypothetical protein